MERKREPQTEWDRERDCEWTQGVMRLDNNISLKTTSPTLEVTAMMESG